LERQALRTATCAGPAAWPASGSAAVRRSCGGREWYGARHALGGRL